MSSPLASMLDVELQPGKPPILRTETTGDAPGWAAEHRDALRAVVAEHGALLVRGLGLRNAAEVGADFRRLAPSGRLSGDSNGGPAWSSARSSTTA